TLGTLHSFRDSGVDYISLGALTHSAGSIDISLDLLTERGTENHEFITNASAANAPR
ncbi:MAG: nicotinate-nucleotide diphosphorylase (carboxylating), partial [Priestia megaterium]